MLHIVADENLAYTDYFFADIAKIDHLSGRKIQNQHLIDKDALLVRSVTKVNKELLQNSRVQFVGSATIGIDHLVIDELEQQQITWANAQGCNAQAVAEYVITALHHVQSDIFTQQKKLKLGIIGLGNVGRRLAKLAMMLGWQVQAYDPLINMLHLPDDLQKVELTDFASVLQNEAISIHVPLTKNQPHATYHLFDENVFNMMNPNAILINAARGEVVSEQALLSDLAKTQRKVVLDVFEHEPHISQQLGEMVSLITPHIAGYSLEGKVKGTAMIYQAFCKHFQIEQSEKAWETYLPKQPILFQKNQSLALQLHEILPHIYAIQDDDRQLRACFSQGKVVSDDFDQLRKNYPLRREWASYGF